MNNEHTYLPDLNSGMTLAPQQYPDQNSAYPTQNVTPLNQFDSFQQYLSDVDSDSDDDSDSESEKTSSTKMMHSPWWNHLYGLCTLVLLAVILFYVLKIRADILGMYEDI
jgi:hypothetical protein